RDLSVTSHSCRLARSCSCPRSWLDSTVLLFFFSSCGAHRDLHSFPTRRSSDLQPRRPQRHPPDREEAGRHAAHHLGRRRPHAGEDRKSTRLNSSHVASSYAVFCLKKKTRTPSPRPTSEGNPTSGAIDLHPPPSD